MSYEERTDIVATLDELQILDDILNCIVHSHSDDAPSWYVEYSHDSNQLKICLPSLSPELLPVDRFNEHFDQSIDANCENNTHWTSEIDDDISEKIQQAIYEVDFENEIDFGDLLTRLVRNIRSKPTLLESVVVSGGIFLTISQQKYARKVVDDFYLWQVESKIEFKLEEYQTKKSGNKYKVIISCERDFRTTLNDFWCELEGDRDIPRLKERFLSYDASEDGQIFDLYNDAIVDQWLGDNDIDYLDYNLIEYFAFDSIVRGPSGLFPGAVGYTHQDEEIYAFNRSVDYSKKRGEKSSLEKIEDDEIEVTLNKANLDALYPIDDVADL